MLEKFVLPHFHTWKTSSC